MSGEPKPHMTAHRAEYHPDPAPHFVMDQATWDTLVAQDEAHPDGFVSGQVGVFSAAGVYIDDCPSLWSCSRANQERAS